MPAGLNMKVVLEGRSDYDAVVCRHADISCVRAHLEDVCALYTSAFGNVFGTESFQEVLDRWQTDGIPSRDVALWVEQLRKVGFEGDDLGEAQVDLRNEEDLPDVSPGAVPVLCAVLEYLSGSAGIGGLTKLVPQEEAP